VGGGEVGGLWWLWGWGVWVLLGAGCGMGEVRGGWWCLIVGLGGFRSVWGRVVGLGEWGVGLVVGVCVVLLVMVGFVWRV